MATPGATHLAKSYLRDYYRSQDADASALSFRKHSVYASTARGTLGLPPPTCEDDINTAVGEFCRTIQVNENAVLRAYTLSMYKIRQLARMVGLTVGSFYRFMDRLIEHCVRFLQSRGVLA